MPGLRSAAVGAVVSDCAGVLKIHTPIYSVLSTHAHSLLTNCPRLQADHAHVSALSKRLIDGLTSRVEHIVRNGDPNGYPGCVNLSFAYVEACIVIHALDLIHQLTIRCREKVC